MKSVRVLLSTVTAVVVLLLAAAVLIDPRAILLPIWLASRPMTDACKKDPVAAYLAGSYYPCQGSPLTRESANLILGSSGQCPLEFAALHAQVGPFQELVALGADPKRCPGGSMRFYENVLGSTCRNDAQLGKQFLDMFTHASIYPSDPTALLFLSARGSCEAGIRLALSLGASVNAEDDNGKTALHYVVGGSEQSLRLSAILVRLGADPDQRVSYGETARAQAKRLNGEGVWPRIDEALTRPTAQRRPIG